MGNSIQVFDYNAHEVRTVEKDGEIWFVAKDVCDVLELSNAREAISSLDDDERSTVRIIDGTSPAGGNPNMNIISEAGVYALIMKSRKPEAHKFSRWVRHEVLPSIHATGSYSTKAQREKNRELDIRSAELLKSMIGMCPMTDETKAVFLHDAYKFLTGKECLSMLPKATEPMYSATDIGNMFDVSKNRIGKIAKQNNLKPEQGSSNEYGTWVRDKSPHSSHECLTFVYNDKAVAWFKEYFKTETR